jgi:hypothetical protein
MCCSHDASCSTCGPKSKALTGKVVFEVNYPTELAISAVPPFLTSNLFLPSLQTKYGGNSSEPLNSNAPRILLCCALLIQYSLIYSMTKSDLRMHPFSPL